MAAVSGLMGMRSASGCLWPIILTQGPSWRRSHGSAKMDASEEDSGRRSDTWRHPSSSGWWRLVSFVFPTRPSCREIARANGYPAAWAGWAVSVSELPLTGRAAGVPLPARGSSPPLVRHSARPNLSQAPETYPRSICARLCKAQF